MVLHTLLFCQNGIKAFSVEIAIVNLMTTRPQSHYDLVMQHRAEACDDWVGI